MFVPDVDFDKIGQRVKTARTERKLSQADLGAMVGCSNNHMSHIEIAQTKVSLSMLFKISYVLGKDVNYFLMDTPFVGRENLIDTEIAEKLEKCDATTLQAVKRVIDVLIDQQEAFKGKDSE